MNQNDDETLTIIDTLYEISIANNVIKYKVLGRYIAMKHQDGLYSLFHIHKQELIIEGA